MILTFSMRADNMCALYDLTCSYSWDNCIDTLHTHNVQYLIEIKEKRRDI